MKSLLTFLLLLPFLAKAQPFAGFPFPAITSSSAVVYDTNTTIWQSNILAQGSMGASVQTLNAVNTFIVSAKSHGYFSLFYYWNMCVGYDINASFIPQVYPSGLSPVTETWQGAAFGADKWWTGSQYVERWTSGSRGMTGNSTLGCYSIIPINPSTAAVNTSLSLWCETYGTAVGGVGQTQIGVSSSNPYKTWLEWASSEYASCSGNGTAATGSATALTGLLGGVANGTTTIYYQNGLSVGTPGSGDGVLPNGNLYFDAYNLIGTGATQFGTRPLAMRAIAQAFTATQASNFGVDENVFSNAMAQAQTAPAATSIDFDSILVPGNVNSTNAISTQISSNDVYLATTSVAGIPKWYLQQGTGGGIADVNGFTNVYMVNSNCPATFPWVTYTLGGTPFNWYGSNCWEWQSYNNQTCAAWVNNQFATFGGPSTITNVEVTMIVTFSPDAQYNLNDIINIVGTNIAFATAGYNCENAGDGGLQRPFNAIETCNSSGTAIYSPITCVLPTRHTMLWIFYMPVGGVGTFYQYDLTSHLSLGACQENIAQGGSGAYKPSNWTLVQMISENIHTSALAGEHWDFAFMGFKRNVANPPSYNPPTQY